MSKKIKNDGVVALALFFSSVSAWADGTIAVPADSVGAAPATSAAGAAAPAAAAQQPGMMGMLLPFALMFGVMYFLMIRPQQKKLKEHQELVGALKHGDEVVTTSGMLGEIKGITDKVVTLEIANNVRVKMLKSQVAQVVKGQIKDLAQP